MKGDSFLPEERQEFHGHIQGIRYLIERRGGFMALCNDPAMSWILIATDLMAYGELSAGWTPLSKQILPPPEPSLSASVDESKSYPYNLQLETLLREYSGAFGNFHAEAQTRKRKCLSNDPEDSAYFMISQIFRPGIHMNLLLTNPICIGCPRICILFLLNVILWENRENLYALFHGYFKQVRLSLVKEHFYFGGSMDRFFWVLITDPETHRVNCAESLWLVARLLRVHVRLSEQLQAEVEKSLLHFIIPEDEDGESCFNPETFHSVVRNDLACTGEYSSFEVSLNRTLVHHSTC